MSTYNRHPLKRAMAISLSAACILLLAACAESDDKASQGSPTQPDDSQTQSTTALRIGTSATSPPYVFGDEANNIVGFIPQALDIIVPETGETYEDVLMDFGGLQPSLTTGRIDAATEFYHTEERAEELDFIDLYNAPFGVMVPSSMTDIASWTDLCGKSVGAVTGASTIDPAVEELNSKHCPSDPVELKHYPDNSGMLLDMNNDRLTSVIDDAGIWSYIADQNPDKYRMAFDAGYPQTWAIAFAKDSPLTAKFRPVVEKFLCSDEAIQLAEENGLNPKQLAIPESCS